MKNVFQVVFIFIILLSYSSCDKDDSQDFKSSPIYMIGASPMSFQYRAPYIKGWGDCIQDYLKNPSMAKNRGRAGSVAGNNPEFGYDVDNYKFFEEVDWNITANEIQNDNITKERKGFLLIQFGENEGRADVTESAYRENLKQYIVRARDMNLIPVLVTSAVGRNTIHSPYGRSLNRVKVKRTLAEDEGVLLLDLYKKTADYTESLLEENRHSTLKRLGYRFGHIGYDMNAHDHNFFNSDFKGIDRTHYEPQGAKLIAGWVRDLACEKSIINDDALKLCQQFNPDIPTKSPTIYCDGEHRDDPIDDEFNGWTVYDNNNNNKLIKHPYTSILTQKVKDGKEEKDGKDRTYDYRVIDLNSHGQQYFIIHGDQSSDSNRSWHNTEQKNISWSMNIDDIQVYIYVLTSNGIRTLYYEDIDSNRGINPTNSSTIRYGLGSKATQKWTDFSRDLEKDLKLFEPQNSIIKVNGFGVYGNGQIDDLIMF